MPALQALICFFACAVAIRHLTCRVCWAFSRTTKSHKLEAQIAPSLLEMLGFQNQGGVCGVAHLIIRLTVQYQSCFCLKPQAHTRTAQQPAHLTLVRLLMCPQRQYKQQLQHMNMALPIPTSNKGPHCFKLEQGVLQVSMHRTPSPSRQRFIIVTPARYQALRLQVRRQLLIRLQ